MHSWPSGMPISFTTKSKVTSSIVNCSPDPLDPKVTFRWLTWPPTRSPTCPWTQLFFVLSILLPVRDRNTEPSYLDQWTWSQLQSGGNDHNFFRHRWKWSQFLGSLVEMITIFLVICGNDHNFLFAFGGNNHNFFRQRWKWSQFFF